MRTTRTLLIALAAAVLGLATTSTASASSIVYLKDGNVWITSPDGLHGYQVTFDGGWESPSEADDGTIMAVKDGETFRLSPDGKLLGAAVPTVFHGADPTTAVGPAGVRISPDGTHQAYWGTVYTSYADFSCGCEMYRWEAFTRWGASSSFDEPNQTKGQELYGEPAWIDNNTLLVSDIGSLFGDQVETYSLGGGDNSLSKWFSDPDPAVKQLQFGTISRAGDKLAFVASTAADQDQIRFYEGTGPAPGVPTPKCAITGPNGGRFSYTTFAPDGSELAWQEGDGVHIGVVPDLSNCSTITNTLLVPGGTEPYFGPADVNQANAPAPPPTTTPPTTTPPTTTPPTTTPPTTTPPSTTPPTSTPPTTTPSTPPPTTTPPTPGGPKPPTGTPGTGGPSGQPGRPHAGGGGHQGGKHHPKRRRHIPHRHQKSGVRGR